jgi:hypothetical protein
MNPLSRLAHPSSGFRFRNRDVLIILVLVEVVGLYILKWPLFYEFNKFAFWDSGSYLASNYLVRQGLSPVVDFGWPYGLLPLLVQDALYNLIGATPAACIGDWRLFGLGESQEAAGRASSPAR